MGKYGMVGAIGEDFEVIKLVLLSVVFGRSPLHHRQQHKIYIDFVIVL